MNKVLKSPVKCHLWKKKKLKAEDFYSAFEVIATYVEDSHFFLRLLQCKKCGQLYFYQFYEETDWEGGNDPQYKTFIPVETQAEIETLKNADMRGLAEFHPRLQSDFPKEADSPNVYWVRE